MGIFEDDPRLTAYALGELPETERAAFEAELRRDPRWQQEIGAIRSASELLSAGLASERTARLSPQRRDAIDQEVRKAIATTQSASARLRQSLRWKPLHKLGAAAAIVICAALLWMSYSNARQGRRVAEAHAQIRRIHEALARYAADHHRLPPDTGFGLDPEDPAAGAGRTYDAGSLWRYLGQSTEVNGKVYGPYLHFSDAELTAYHDPVKGASFYVVDPWGTAVGYVGDARRVVHNTGQFDLFSAGPDRKTGGQNAAANLAYDGIDNNGDGIVDNADELGDARLNGALTMASPEARNAAVQLDDVNNWDE